MKIKMPGHLGNIINQNLMRYFDLCRKDKDNYLSSKHE